MIDIKSVAAVSLGVISLLQATAAISAANHPSSAVSIIQPPHVSANCLFFKLDGVSEADPALPGNPWFAVPTGHPGYRETFVVLLAAQKAGTTVWVRTTGQAAGGACGQNAAVDFVISNPS